MSDRHQLLWSVLVRFEEPPRLWPDLAVEVGLDDASIERLRGYVKESLVLDRQHQQSLARERFSGLTQDVSLKVLISKLEALDEATSQWHKTLVAGLSTILDVESVARLESWVELQVQRGSLGFLRTDHHESLAPPGAREALVERALRLRATEPGRTALQPWSE